MPPKKKVRLYDVDVKNFKVFRDATLDDSSDTPLLDNNEWLEIKSKKIQFGWPLLTYVEDNKVEGVLWRQSCDIKPADDEEPWPAGQQGRSWSLYGSVGETKPWHVIQQNIDDCWFEAVVAAIVNKNIHFIRSVYSLEQDGSGLWQVKLYQDGKRVLVRIQDNFPCNKKEQLMYARPLYCQLFVPLGQKAVAFSSSTYEAINMNVPYVAFSILTGLPSGYLPLHPDKLTFLWDMLYRMDQVEQCPMVGHCGTDIDPKIVTEKEYDDNGLQTVHSYTIIRLMAVKSDSGEPVLLIRLYEPKGKGSWNGEWSDGDQQHWNTVNDLLSTLPTELHPNMSKKGVFWMPFSEFLKYFQFVSFCHLSSRADFEYRYEGRFARDGNDHHNNVFYRIVIKEDATRLRITLHQSSRPSRAEHAIPLLFIGFVIYRMDDCSENMCGVPVGFTGYHSDLLKYIEVHLDRGTYLLAPLSFNHWNPTVQNVKVSPSEAVHNRAQHNILSLFTTKRVDVTPATYDPPKQVDALQIMPDAIYALVCSDSFGVPPDHFKGCLVYSFKSENNWIGLVVVVANFNQQSIQFIGRFLKWTNLRSCRGDNENHTTDDIIPAKCFMVVNLLQYDLPPRSHTTRMPATKGEPPHVGPPPDKREYDWEYDWDVIYAQSKQATQDPALSNNSSLHLPQRISLSEQAKYAAKYPVVQVEQ